MYVQQEYKAKYSGVQLHAVASFSLVSDGFISTSSHFLQKFLVGDLFAIPSRK